MSPRLVSFHIQEDRGSKVATDGYVQVGYSGDPGYRLFGLRVFLAFFCPYIVAKIGHGRINIFHLIVYKHPTTERCVT
jgi:hypothetical protein